MDCRSPGYDTVWMYVCFGGVIRHHFHTNLDFHNEGEGAEIL
jgi:hypothetical protein